MKLPFLPARAPCPLPRHGRRGCYPRDYRVLAIIRDIVAVRDADLIVWLFRCGDVATMLGARVPRRHLPTPYHLM